MYGMYCTRSPLYSSVMQLSLSPSVMQLFLSPSINVSLGSPSRFVYKTVSISVRRCWVALFFLWSMKYTFNFCSLTFSISLTAPTKANAFRLSSCYFFFCKERVMRDQHYPLLCSHTFVSQVGVAEGIVRWVPVIHL